MHVFLDTDAINTTKLQRNLVWGLEFEVPELKQEKKLKAHPHKLAILGPECGGTGSIDAD